MDKIPTQDEYENAFECDTNLDKKILKLNDLNLILLINTSSSVGKVAFEVVRNTKKACLLEGNCKIAWDRLRI